jgi:hypothetical protein
MFWTDFESSSVLLALFAHPVIVILSASLHNPDILTDPVDEGTVVHCRSSLAIRREEA